jgi:hypothetical protein
VDTKNLEKYLDSFGKAVIKKSKGLLQTAKGETALGKSIRFKVDRTEQGFATKFYMNDYGEFLDKGVSGNKKSYTYTNYDEKVVSSPYKYTVKQPPPTILSKWIKRKGIKPKGLGRGRDKETGRFISNLAFLIGRKIKRDGIKSLSFFQAPLGIELKKLKEKMLTELKLDIETYITTFYKPK